MLEIFYYEKLKIKPSTSEKSFIETTLKNEMGKKKCKWKFYLLNFRQYVLLGWGCGAIQFPSMMTNSKQHNLTFHLGCNVLYHPSTSSITPLIWFSFIHIHSFPKTPNPIFHFFHFTRKPNFSIHINTKWRKESSRAKKDNERPSVAFYFSFTILFHALSMYGLASLVYLNIFQLFFLIFFWYNILLFDSLFFVWW